MTDSTSGSSDYGPQGGPGYGGGVGGQYGDPNDPYQIYTDMGMGTYDPWKIQQAIRSILDTPLGAGQHLGQGALMAVFSLMSTYGQQTVGFDSEIQNKLNSYIGAGDKLNQDLDEANQDASTTSGQAGGGTSDFLYDLKSFYNELNSDPFFSLPGQSAMKTQILSSLSSLSGLASVAGGLERLWDLYKGSWGPNGAQSPGSASSGVSDPTGINSVTSTLTMLSSQVGGVNKGQLAKTQYDTSLTTTEQDAFNNFMKKLYSLYLMILGQMKTQ